MWAHTDDDLIFANPALADTIGSGQCVRSLYITAGDAGRGERYFRGRELGILRAYNVMRGQPGGFWDQSKLTLAGGATVTQFLPQGDPRVSILVLRLPDGGLDGRGFASTGRASMSQLLRGEIAQISPLDGGAPVSAAALQSAIDEVLSAFPGARVLTNIPGESPIARGDHPDHSVVGSLVRSSATRGIVPLDSVTYFVGYPTQDLPANVSDATLQWKIDIFRTYAKEDPVIACSDNHQCLKRARFGTWLQRSYPKSDAELGIP